MGNVATKVETYTPAMAHAAVKRGAAWMDEHCPDWLSKIDLDVLDLHETDRCVLGQTARCLLPDWEECWTPEYDDVVGAFAEAPSERRWSIERGFNVPEPIIERGDNEYPVRYEMLTVAWREYIRERLAVQA